MAIYSLSASTVGRSTHAPGTAGAHVAYIGRTGAAEAITAERMPADIDQARAWLDAAEPTLRRNARVISKFTVAIPAEITDPADRLALVREFGEVASAGAVPWLGAVHRPSRGGDDRNWHAHLVIHDRHPVTGKTVAGLSDKGTLDRLRVTWELLANAALERVGAEARVDCRSLRDQGINAPRPVHLGPAATALERRGILTEVGDLARGRQAIRSIRTDLETARDELASLELERAAAIAVEASRRARAELAELQREHDQAFQAECAALVTEATLRKQAEAARPRLIITKGPTADVDAAPRPAQRTGEPEIQITPPAGDAGSPAGLGARGHAGAGPTGTPARAEDRRGPPLAAAAEGRPAAPVDRDGAALPRIPDTGAGRARGPVPRPSGRHGGAPGSHRAAVSRPDARAIAAVMAPAGAADRARAMAAFAAATAPRWTPKLIQHRRKMLAGYFLEWIDASRNRLDLVNKTESIQAVLGEHTARALRGWYAARSAVAASNPVAAKEIAAVKAWANPLRNGEGKVLTGALNAAMNAIVPGARLGFVPPARPVITNTITKPAAPAKRIDTGPSR